MFFFFKGSGHHRDLHSFPTRRSSDLYGAASGAPEPLEIATLAAKGSLYVQRPTIKTYVRTPELLRTRAGQVLDLVVSGRLDVRIGATYPLAEARRAHEDLEARRTTGKLLLLP